MELIKIRNIEGKSLVSARELHLFLESTDRFNRWFDRQLKYGFDEGIDFTSVKSFTLVNNGAKRELEDYALTLDTAKEISMIQRTNKGKEARQYFIECEKKLLSLETKNFPSYPEALRLYANQLEQNQKLEKQNKKLVEDYNSLEDKAFDIWELKRLFLRPTEEEIEKLEKKRGK